MSGRHDPFERLKTAFFERTDSIHDDGRPVIGWFGESIPLAVIAAFGAVPVEIKAPPRSHGAKTQPHSAVRQIAEPFLDPYCADFLHRFASDEFQSYAALIFARSDVAALTAYQYATELQRLGMIKRTGPELLLWNMQHGTSAHIDRFNDCETARLYDALSKLTGRAASSDDVLRAQERETQRYMALQRLRGHRDAFMLRNAGRWMDVSSHTAALNAIPVPPAPTGRSVGLVGAACDTPLLYDLVHWFGNVAVDLTGYGDTWPPPPPTDDDPIKAMARDPLSIRTNPPQRYRDALLTALQNTDLVVCAVDETDDAFGWDIPAIKAATEARGARFIDLGFLPRTLQTEWLDVKRNMIEGLVS